MPAFESPHVARRQYARLFQAKVLTLLATGVATIELAVLAVNIAGDDAGALLGTALALKSLSLVVAPLFMSSLLAWMPRGRSLIAIDLLRAMAMLGLVFVSTELSFLGVIVVFLVASAAFRVTYLEYVAHLIPDRAGFAAAMSKSRIVDELESAISPLLAATLLVLLPMEVVLVLTALAFVASAIRIGMADLPDIRGDEAGPRWRRGLSGLMRFATDPALKPLSLLMVPVAAGTAMVMTNTPALVSAVGGRDASAIAFAYGAFGLGAVVGALAVVRLGARLSDRATMLGGAFLIAGALLAGPLAPGFLAILPLWFLIGAGVALIQTPGAALIRHAAQDSSMMTKYGAGMALQNLLLVLAYPVAGWLAAGAGFAAAFLGLAALSALAMLVAVQLWRSQTPPDPWFDEPDPYRALVSALLGRAGEALQEKRNER